jgi:hypothetical protein
LKIETKDLIVRIFEIVSYEEEIAQWGQEKDKKLRKAQVVDKADPKQAAITMLAARKRKLHFKQLI